MKNCSVCGKPTKKNHSMCRRHYIGEERWNKEKLRNKKQRRNFRIKFKCEMDYSDCNSRGYCNGDC